MRIEEAKKIIHSYVSEEEWNSDPHGELWYVYALARKRIETEEYWRTRILSQLREGVEGLEIIGMVFTGQVFLNRSEVLALLEKAGGE